MREISFQTALDEAVAEEMRRDPRVITLGTDFTGNPIKEFGAARVRFTGSFTQRPSAQGRVICAWRWGAACWPVWR